MKNGKVIAILDSGEEVVVSWRGARGKGKKKYPVIKYEKDRELIETPDYKLKNEIFEK